MSVAGLVAGVTAFLRLRRALARARADGVQSAPTLMTVAPLPRPSLENLRQDSLSWAFAQKSALKAQGLAQPEWLEALYSPDAQTVGQVRPDAPEWAVAQAVQEACADWGSAPEANPYGLTVAESYFLHAVEAEGAARRRWVRVARTLADSVLDVVAAYPQALGLELRAQTIVSALAGQMSAVIGTDDDINASEDEAFGERAFRVFLEATLATAVERPDFLAEEAHLQALAVGILQPLHAEVAANRDRQWIALDRLRELMRGPVAHGALKALKEHQDEFLKGDFADDQLLGAVTRVVLGEVVSIGPDRFNVRGTFTAQGALVVYRAALRVAQERPELFIDGQGGPSERAQRFLSGVAEVLAHAPFPYTRESGLAPQIAVVALEVAQAYVARRLVEDTGRSDWSQAGMDAASHIMHAVFEGLKAGLVQPEARRNPLAQLFSRSMAVEVLQIIALHVAQRPGMITGPDGSVETRGVAAAFAAMVAEDTSGLLRGEDWRRVLSQLLHLVADNPGALIGVNREESPTSFVSVQLISRLLRNAAESLARPAAERRPRLMGARLAEMIEVTLAAAANNVIAGLRDPEQERRHFEAFDAFLVRLGTLAVGQDVTLRMSAADLQHVYQWFVALVLDRGPDAAISDNDIRMVIRGSQNEVEALRVVTVAAAGRPAVPAGSVDDDDEDGVASGSGRLDSRPEPISLPDADDEPTSPPPPASPSASEPPP